MTEFPRAKIDRMPMADKRRFKLTLRTDQFSVGTDGSLHIWLDRGDVSNLVLDGNAMLLDDDMEASGGEPYLGVVG